MPNTHFTFKQFTIHQDQTAMKVITDACILGAYTDVQRVKNILDIGTDTGLLSLMLAQRSHAKIDAIEIDEGTYNQAVVNVNESIFKDKIRIFNVTIQSYIPPSGVRGLGLRVHQKVWGNLIHILS